MKDSSPERLEPLFDSHAHLTFDSFADDLDAVLDRARAAGVVGVVTIGSGGGPALFEDARALAAEHDWIWATAGLHPHDARLGTASVLAALDEAAAAADVVAVGEAGLDYHYDNSPRSDQRRVFEHQLRLARELGKPIIVHTREADQDTLALIDTVGVGSGGGVIHCFSGDPEFASAVIERGFHVSFSGIVTFKSAVGVREAAALVPDERLLIETDCPFLAPPPYRGRRNEPAFVGSVARTLTELRGISAIDVARITAGNARAFYGLPQQVVAPIVYTIRDQLYVNATNRCTLACVFCPKRRDWTVKGHQLRHEREPSDEEIRAALWGARPEDAREVVFCGLGESTMRFDLVVELGRELRRRGIRTRLDTDGLASLRQGREVVDELAEAFDEVSVSLNAADGETYQRLCPSEYGAAAWDAVVAFLRAAKGRFDQVTASVVAVPELDLEPIRQLVEQDLGVPFRVRSYNVVG